MSSSYNTVPLVDNASKLSTEMAKEIETLAGIKRIMKEQLCRCVIVVVVVVCVYLCLFVCLDYK